MGVSVLPNVPDDVLIETLRAYEAAGRSQRQAARQLGVSRDTVQQRLAAAHARNLTAASTPDGAVTEEKDRLRFRVKTLEAELSQARSDQMTTAAVRREIIRLRDATADIRPPRWVQGKGARRGENILTPVTIWSDWHWGEVVEAAQVNGINAYSLEIANQRAERVLEGTINLAFNYTVHGDYPGIVLALGGDMVSGTIHEELSATNDKPIMPVVVDLFGALKRNIRALKERFGRVYVPCIAGNHGRTTITPRYKDAAFTSYDWLIYSLLEKDFEDDEAIAFSIPDGSDQRFDVWNHRFMLAHGDKLGVRGGDGIIGALGPIIRGSFKMHNSSAAIGLDFDTLMLGHFHQYLPMPRIIGNGSLIGFNEYAKDRLRAVPERPQQALCFVHPENGIVSQMAVYADQRDTAEVHDWVRWATPRTP